MPTPATYVDQPPPLPGVVAYRMTDAKSGYFLQNPWAGDLIRVTTYLSRLVDPYTPSDGSTSPKRLSATSLGVLTLDKIAVGQRMWPCGRCWLGKTTPPLFQITGVQCIEAQCPSGYA